ncbi:CsbD family protein [Cyanobium gracile UHCC 0139]|uniref:CsbD family protein n=1 Tax=Cyanobium gracile UHCC 0139 TaxID=3110308 RepID=A0ABU5RU00_9CYAN|nr:CsbD family protein [Cyanobium gracile]MEA5391219.1 CsbD family protein [Cyanobium gracile UHCC 0139]
MRIRIRQRLFTLASMAAMVISLMIQWPAMAMASHAPSLTPVALATMSDKMSAKAKEAEGKMESAYGEITGDTGHQVKGKAKQVQASAMNAAEAVKDGTRDVARKASDATDKLANKIK